MKNPSLKISLSYGSFLLLLLAFACQKANQDSSSYSVTSHDISCAGSAARFQISDEHERLGLSDLPAGTYEYGSGEAYFESAVDGRGFHAKESISKTAVKGQIAISSQYVCREGFGREELAAVEASEVAPRTMLLGPSGSADSYFRSFRMFTHEGKPAFDFGDAGHPTDFRRGLEARIAAGWDEYAFVHTGFKTYSFVASKKTESGILRVRIVYHKPDSKILEEGDLFFPFPNSNAF